VSIGDGGLPQVESLYPAMPQMNSVTTDAAGSQWLVAWPSGVSWRKSADFADKLPGNGPAHGSRVSGQVVQGASQLQYLRVADRAYLPLTMPDGRPVLQKVGVAAPAYQPPSTPHVPAAAAAAATTAVVQQQHRPEPRQQPPQQASRPSIQRQWSTDRVVYPAVQHLRIHLRNATVAPHPVPPLIGRMH